MDPALERIIRAWTVAGPVPSHHRGHQARLRREWPTLARALDDAAQHAARPPGPMGPPATPTRRTP